MGERMTEQELGILLELDDGKTLTAAEQTLLREVLCLRHELRDVTRERDEARLSVETWLAEERAILEREAAEAEQRGYERGWNGCRIAVANRFPELFGGNPIANLLLSQLNPPLATKEGA